MKALDVLKQCQSFVVIGLSDQPEKYSYRIYQCLKQLNKHVYGISPRLQSLDGQTVYRSLKEIPERIEVAVFVVAPLHGYVYLDECKQLQVPYLWMQPGTYDDQMVLALKESRIPYFLDCILRQEQALREELS